MEDNKETRMISSDEIFYAVLKDGTIVNNVKSLLTLDEQDKLRSLCEKLLTADMDILKGAESCTAREKTLLLISFSVAQILSHETKKKIFDELKSGLLRKSQNNEK